MMRSTFAGLNTMVRGLEYSQIALNTVGHNISNANTDGYSRQRVNATAMPSRTLYGFSGLAQVGQGVDIVSIVRARDVFADKQYWRESANTEYATAKQQTYDKIESIFSDLKGVGIQGAMNEFWQSLKNLSTAASDGSMRTLVRDKGKVLVEKIQKDTSQLQDLIEDNTTSLEMKVQSVNQITKQIAALNKQIITAEGTGGMANDLRDTRDSLVDQLSKLINVSVRENANGSYSITSEGNSMVEGDGYSELDTISTPNREYGTRDVKVVFKNSRAAFNMQNGELKGLQDSIETAKGYIDDMARISAYLLTEFNAQHQQGFGINDETGINFFGRDGEVNADNSGNLLYEFDPATNTVIAKDRDGLVLDTFNTIEMIQELSVNSRFDAEDSATGAMGTDLIAAKSKSSTDPDAEDVASGSNALLLGELINTNKSAMLGNSTLTGFYTGMIAELGVAAQSVDRTVTNQENIMAQTEDWRSRVSGLNWNEELTDMIRFQQAYKSASRCLTAMDEMLDKLINGTGSVGR